MKIGIVMGSTSDKPVMNAAAEMLDSFGVEYEVKVLSAHRTPLALEEWASSARERGFAAIIAAAGGAAHLAGAVAAHTTLPVIAVPIRLRSFEGLDSLLSMVQMPSGVPVATMAIDGAKNAALFAVEMLAITDAEMSTKLDDFRAEQARKVLEANEE